MHQRVPDGRRQTGEDGDGAVGEAGRRRGGQGGGEVWGRREN